MAVLHKSGCVNQTLGMLLIPLCLFTAVNAKADTSEQEQLTSTGMSIKIVTGDFPPFTGADLRDGGLITQIVRAAFQQQGIHTKVSFRPWKRGYKETLSTHYQATFPYSKSAEREQLFHYSDPILLGQTLFYTHKKSSIDYQQLDDLYHRTLCMPLGYNLFTPLAKAIDQGNMRLVQASDLKSCFLMIHSGRADLTLVRKEAANQLLHQDLSKFSQDFRSLTKPFSSVSEHLIVSRNQSDGTAIIQAFNAGLAELKHSGRIQQILLED